MSELGLLKDHKPIECKFLKTVSLLSIFHF
jgi:hypothetical protein